MQPEIDPATNLDSINTDGVLSVDKQQELDAIQEAAANDALNFLDVKTPEDPYPLIAMATGIGKGRIIHKIIDRTIRKNPNAKVLVIAGTKLTLVDQTQTALHGYTLEANGGEHAWEESELTDELIDDTEDISEEKFEPSFLYTAIDYKKRNERPANVHVATIQTIQSEKGKGNINPDDYDLVVVDEAHNIGTQARVDTVEQFKNVVGFTATPFRHSGVLKTPEQYGFTIINSLTLPEAQERDFLPPLIESAIPTSHLIEEIPTNLKGDIDYKKLEKLLKESDDLRPFIAEKIHEYIQNGEDKKKTIIAVNFVWEAEELAHLLKEKGISVGVAVNQQAAKQIHSEEIPALDSIARYKLPKEDSNGIQVLISPYVASEGFDAPLTEVLVWASPTDSSVRYTQFTGRLARRSPGKQFGHVIDFLYQTSQYNWSYNFGQWMKDTVVQLPDGRLFQGSKKQRIGVSGSEELHKIEKISHPKIELNELFNTSALLPLQEGEMGIGIVSVSGQFIGDDKTVMPIAIQVIEELRGEHPGMLVERRNGTRIVTAVTDPAEFRRRMIEKGAIPQREIPSLQEGEMAISQRLLASHFVGSYKTVMPIASQVIEELSREHPGMVVERRNGTRIFTAVTDPAEFRRRMIKKGAIPQREIPVLQEGEMGISKSSLATQFIGGYEKLAPIASQVIEELRGEHPEMVVERRRGKCIIQAVTELEEFRRRMIEKGAIPQREIPSLQEGEMGIGINSLKHHFIGGSGKYMPIANQVIEELSREHPGMVVERRSGSNITQAVTDPEEFKRRMTEKGVKIRENIETPPLP